MVCVTRAGAGAVIAILLFSTVAATGALAPPYRGVVWTLTDGLAATGCGATAKNVVKAGWSPVNGIGHLAESASAKTCGKSLGGFGNVNQGFANGELAIWVSVKVATTGHHSVAVNWTITRSDTETIVIGGVCPAPHLGTGGSGSSDCSASSAAFIESSGYLVDTTNGTYIYSGHYWSTFSNFSQFNSTSCSHFKCSYSNGSSGTSSTFSGATSLTSWYNGTLVKSHHYVVFTYILGAAETYLHGYPRSAASAALNLATLGNGAKLTGITIT